MIKFCPCSYFTGADYFLSVVNGSERGRDGGYAKAMKVQQEIKASTIWFKMENSKRNTYIVNDEREGT